MLYKALKNQSRIDFEDVMVLSLARSLFNAAVSFTFPDQIYHPVTSQHMPLPISVISQYRPIILDC